MYLNIYKCMINTVFGETGNVEMIILEYIKLYGIEYNFFFDVFSLRERIKTDEKKN